MTISNVTQSPTAATQHKSQNAPPQRDPDHDGDTDPAGVPDKEKGASHHLVNIKA